MVHICNNSTCEAEAGGLQVQGQLMLHRKTLYKTNQSKTKAQNHYHNKLGAICYHSMAKLILTDCSPEPPKTDVEVLRYWLDNLEDWGKKRSGNYVF